MHDHGMPLLAVGMALALVACGGEDRPAAPTPTEAPRTFAGTPGPLALNPRFSCAARDGVVTCWGLHPRAGTEPSIATYPELAGSVQIVASDGMLCGRREDGTVHCNRRRFFRGGPPDALEIAPVAGIDDAISVVVGQAHACALHEGGRVSCWGANSVGQLGDASLGSRGAPVPVDVEGVTALAATRERTCAVADGRIVCWGRELSMESDEPQGPMVLDASETFTAVAHGISTMCALDSTGRAHCWGDDRFGMTDPPDARFEALVAAPYAFCGQSSSGWTCWGHETPSEAAIAAMADAPAVAFGDHHGCLLAADGSVSCWGDNDRGQVLGSLTHQRPPSRVAALDDAIDVQSNDYGRCALRRDGHVVCWGCLDPLPWEDATEEGERPEPPPERCSSVPVARSGVEGAVELAVAPEHACARDRAGALFCWGSNEHGQLGLPEVTIAREGQRVPGIEGVEGVCAADGYTCVITADRRVACIGQAGEGDYIARTWTPVARVTGAQRIACGGLLTCALLEGGDVVCWGDDLTQDRRILPGRATPPAPARPPTARRFATGATDLWVGDAHVCVRTAEHPLACFGYGDTGELGVERCGGDERCVLTRDLVPFPEARVDDRVFLARGTCLGRPGEPVRCWGGRDAHYEGFSLEPAALPETEDAVGLTTGCARFADGSVKCWGSNRGGEVGDGSRVGTDVVQRVPLGDPG